VSAQRTPDWKRTHRAVWVANLATAVGMMSFLPFFPSHLERLGVHGDARLALWTGLVFGAAPLSAAVMSPIWGALGDRFGRRLMVIRSMVAITVFVGAMPHSSDAAANHATPMMKRRRRPKRSPSAPPTRISAASVNV